ncbi:MAG TPA: tetratricopeptide repeat protein, partial [Candidatus Binatia bacterium]
MKAALRLVVVFMGFSIYAWPQSPTQNLTALHVEAENAYLARDLTKAAEFSRSLLSAASQAGDRKEMAFAELNLGRIFGSEGDYTQALEALNRALELYQGADDLSGVATVFNQQAVAYRYTGKIS